MSEVAVWLHPVKKILSLRILISLCRLLVGAVFVYAALMKIPHPEEFAAEIEHFRIVPAAVALWLGYYLPWLELAAGVGMWFPTLRKWAGPIICVLLLCFIAAVCAALVRGIDVRCGCFGSDTAQASAWWWLIRNLFLLGMTLVAASRQGGSEK